MYIAQFRNVFLALFVASMMLASTNKDWHAVSESTHSSMTEIAVLVGPLRLGSGPTRCVLASPTGPAQNAPSLASRLSKLSQQHLYLVFKNLYAAEPPGVLYQVYLDLPEGAGIEKNDPHHVGSLNFFQAGRITDSNKKVADESAFRSLDITQVAKTLQQRGLLNDATTVTIIPDAPPSENSKITIGRIALIEQ